MAENQMESLKILLVEDNPVFARLVQGTLSKSEAPWVEVLHATQLSEALEHLATAPLDAVLLDLMLPDSAGVETFAAVKQVCGNLPVVILTGSDDPDLVQQLLEMGAQHYLLKGEVTPAVLKGILVCSVRQRRMQAETEREFEQLAALVEAVKGGQVDSIIGSGAGAPVYRLECAELVAENERLMKELTRSNAELYEFTSVASHDLKAPLRSITHFCEQVRRSCQESLDETNLDYLDRAVGAARRMTRLVDDLLEYARVGQSERQPGPVDLGEASAGALAELSAVIEETRAQIEVDRLPRVHGDDVGLGQLLQNLVANAIKFHGEQPPEVRIEARRLDSAWEISVTDNGIGIDPKHHEQILAPFTRLHNRTKYEGSGIGLATCKKIVERHGGEIWVDSEPGEGASFHFTLPDEACA